MSTMKRKSNTKVGVSKLRDTVSVALQKPVNAGRSFDPKFTEIKATYLTRAAATCQTS